MNIYRCCLTRYGPLLTVRPSGTHHRRPLLLDTIEPRTLATAILMYQFYPNHQDEETLEAFTDEMIGCREPPWILTEEEIESWLAKRLASKRNR